MSKIKAIRLPNVHTSTLDDSGTVTIHWGERSFDPQLMQAAKKLALAWPVTVDLEVRVGFTGAVTVSGNWADDSGRSTWHPITGFRNDSDAKHGMPMLAKALRATEKN